MHYRIKRRKITQKMLADGLRVTDYAKKYGYSIDGIKSQLKARKVICFKWRGFLFVLNPEKV